MPGRAADGLSLHVLCNTSAVARVRCAQPVAIHAANMVTHICLVAARRVCSVFLMGLTVQLSHSANARRCTHLQQS